MTTTTGTPTTSPTERLIAALAAAWQAIQTRHAELPDVVIAFGGTSGYSQAGPCGHYATARWPGRPDEHAELFVSGHGLTRPAEEVFATLLHEAAHGIAAARGESDTSRQGRYHNKTFRGIATELGLIVERDESRGYGATRLPPPTAATYAGELAALAAAITAYRPGGPTGARRGESGRDTNLAKAQCHCPRIIRVARATLAAAPIVCTACEHEFTTTETAGEQNRQATPPAAPTEQPNPQTPVPTPGEDPSPAGEHSDAEPAAAPRRRRKRRERYAGVSAEMFDGDPYGLKRGQRPGTWLVTENGTRIGTVVRHYSPTRGAAAGWEVYAEPYLRLDKTLYSSRVKAAAAIVDQHRRSERTRRARRRYER